MLDLFHEPEWSDAAGAGAAGTVDPELWKELEGKELVPLLDQFLKRYALTVYDVAHYCRIKPGAIRSTVVSGEFAPEDVSRLLGQVRDDRVMTSTEYFTWHKALFLAAYLHRQLHLALGQYRDIWHRPMARALYQALSQAYDESRAFTDLSVPSVLALEETWRRDWAWIRVPRRYRVSRVEWNRYDLECTSLLQLGRLKVLGPGLRTESKGWGTGAYRIYRISTDPLGDPRTFEPDLVHVPAGEFWLPGQDERTNGETSRQVESPRKVHLDEYWIGRYPVTVAQFTFYVDHHGYATTEEEKFGSAWISWRQPYHRQDRDIRAYTPLVEVNDKLSGSSYLVMPLSLLATWLTLRPRSLHDKWRWPATIVLWVVVALTVYFLVLMGNRPYQITVAAFVQRQGLLSTGPLLILAGAFFLLGAEYLASGRERMRVAAPKKRGARSRLSG